jgi:hypothetical protein
LNGITEVATSSDLIDRSIFVTLPPIAEEQRKEEEKFWARFDEARPRLLGALLDAVVYGLKNLPNVKLERLPRMADFAKWVVACEPALGWKAGTFLDAYQANRSSANELALESSLVSNHVVKLLQDKRKWEGTASQLLARINSLADDREKELKFWPQTPRALSGTLRRLAPNLRREHINIEFSDTPRRGRGRLITIARKSRGRHRSHRSHRSQNAESSEDLRNE